MSDKHDKSDDDVDSDLEWLIQSNEPENDQETTVKAATEQKTSGDEHSDKNTKDEPAVDGSSADDETDDDYEDVLTPDERKLLHHNTSLNDAEEGEDYDVKQRLEEANKALASEESREEDREKRVAFKPGLVDFEAPPPDSSSSSSSSEDELDPGEVTSGMKKLDLNSSTGSTVEINGQFLRADEKILIERGGKFEVVEAGELTGILPAESQPQASAKATLPPVKARPKSAPIKSPHTFTPTRPSSAAPANQQYASKVNYRTFSYSQETKNLIKKQAELRAKREAEEEKRRKTEEDLARQEADEAWRAWVDRKNEDIRKQKREEQEEKKKQERLNRKDPEEIEDAYKAWLKQKMNQIRRERIMTQQQQIEYDEGWYLRERRDCNRAFRAWLRNKSEMSRKVKETEVRLRKQSIREMRRARKAQKMMASIRAAQQMKYIEYYGYRI